MTTKYATCPAEMRTTLHAECDQRLIQDAVSGPLLGNRVWECQSCLNRSTEEQQDEAAQRVTN